jgi:serine/threonine protein kinase
LAGDVVDERQGSGDSPQRALEYAALERGTNAPANDPRSDLFFLGAIYYELLTGEAPFPRTRSRDERRQFSRYANARPIRSIDPNIPRAVCDVVERLMKISPEQRYQSAAVLVSDLRMILAEGGANGNSVVNVAPPAEMPRKESDVPRHRPTVMCIEHRLRQQNLLRDYLSKRGFRVLVLNDVQRGMKRLQSDPPDCVLLMGESIGDEIVDVHLQATKQAGAPSFISIAVLAERQADLRQQLKETPTNRILVQPVSLRDLRREIHLSIQRRKHQTDQRANGSRESKPRADAS